jgi:tetratricopeptide (TPR) repeat protein
VSEGDVQADHPVSAHPDDERLAAFVDGALDGGERAEVELHLASCDACGVAVAEIVRTVEGLEAEERAGGASQAVHAVGTVVPRSTGRRGWLYGAAGLAAAAAVVLAVWLPRGERPELRELVEAVGDRRPVEGRLTGGFRYGPLASPARGTEASADWRVLAAAGRLEEDARGTDDARLLGALGTAHLVTRQFDAAVKYFDQALEIAPDDVLLRTDRAAALLARGDAAGGGRAADYVRALDDATRAVLTDPKRAEAVFNKAMALRRMHLADQELEAWRAYLALDADSPWAAEAKRRVADLEASQKSQGRWHDHRDRLMTAADRGDRVAVERVTREFAGHVRTLVEDELLPAWAKSQLAGDAASAARQLRRARALADALVAGFGERLPADAVAFAVRTPQVASAYAAWGQARREYAADRMASAREGFARTREALGSEQPVRVLADLYFQIARFVAHEYDATTSEFSRLARLCASRDYRAAAGAAERMLGLASSHRGDPLAALEAHQRSWQWYQVSGDRSGVAGALVALADAHRQLGRRHDAWAAWGPAAAALEDSESPRRMQSGYVSVAQAALRDELPGAGLVFQEQAVRAARAWGLPGPRTESLAMLARVKASLGDHEGISAAIRAAQESVADVPESVRHELEVARVHDRRVPSHVRHAALARALAFWAASSHPQRLPALYLARAASWEGPDRAARARADLEEGVRVFEKTLALDAAPAPQYFDQAWGLFDALVSLEIEQGDAAAALRAWERGKARRLLARLGGEPIGDPIGTAQRVLTADTSVLCFAVTHGVVHVWTVTRDGVRFRRLPIDPRRLGRLVAEQSEGGDDVWSQLYDALIRPISDGLGPARRLVIAADAPLNRVAFAGLLDTRRRRFLVEDFSISTVPSMSAFIRLAQNPPARRTALQVSSVGVADAVSTLGLPALPRAPREAAAVAAMYATAPVDAVDLPSSLRDTDVLHFAGHAVANAEYPDLSFLIAGAAEGRVKTLTAGDLRTALRGSRLRLAVLSACATGAGVDSRSEGLLGLAQPFLEHGTSAVVASLWAVRDDVAHDVAVALHREYAAGAAAAEALRRAQLQFVHRRPAMDWAAFTHIGS